MKWLQKRTPKYPTIPLDYPAGVFVRTELDTYYIQGKQKWPVLSDRALDSWSITPLEGTEVSVSKFTKGPRLGFRNGSLIKNIADSKIYLISENKRRHIVSPDADYLYGFTLENAMVVSDEEVNFHPEGEVF